MRTPNPNRLSLHILAVVAAMTLLAGTALRGAEPRWDPPANAWLVFASATCEECEWLKLDFLPELETRFDQRVPTVAFIDIDDLQNYALLTEVEAILDAETGQEVPAFLVGRTMLYGKNAIAEWGRALDDGIPKPTLPPEVVHIAARATDLQFYADEFNVAKNGAKTASDTETDPAQDQQEPADEPGDSAIEPAAADAGQEVGDYRQATVLYFETTGCKECARAEKQLAYALSQVSGAAVHRVDTMEPDGKAMQYAVTAQLDLPASKRLVTPMFVSADTTLYEDSISDRALIELLRTAPADPFWQTWDEKRELTQARQRLRDLASDFTLPAVIAAGLIDGINPCAFAVIVFLVSYLTLTGRLGRKFALLYGLTFAAGVFVCYFLIGLGFFQLLGVLQTWQSAMRWVFIAMGVVCVGFGIGGAIDTVAAVRGGAGKMTFGMPKSLHRVTHRLIREDVSRQVLGVGAFLIGIAVSGLELVCTGQIYLPIIVFINSSAPGVKSVIMLLVYNTAFIVPLIIVVLLGSFGLGSKALSNWARRHAAATRALTTILVFALAGVMFVMAARA